MTPAEMSDLRQLKFLRQAIERFNETRSRSFVDWVRLAVANRWLSAMVSMRGYYIVELLLVHPDAENISTEEDLTNWATYNAELSEERDVLTKLLQKYEMVQQNAHEMTRSYQTDIRAIERRLEVARQVAEGRFNRVPEGQPF